MTRWVVCASGPSMLSVDLCHLRRFRSWRVMVINNTWELLPWADALYASDVQWWNCYGDKAGQFMGQKWGRDDAGIWHGAKSVKTGKGDGLNFEPWTVNTGGNSGYQALNLLYHLGAKQIVLLGYDMHRYNGGHWHGEHVGERMLSAPKRHIDEWVTRFEPLARDLQSAGVRVINATPGSALECFPRLPMGEALRQG